MWWSRGIACFLLIGLVAGCGYRPLYGDYRVGGPTAELALIKVEPIPDRAGQLVHNRLLDVINPNGRPVEAKYLLDITLVSSVNELGFGKTALATRVNLEMTANYSLIDSKTGRQLTSGSAKIVSSYNLGSSPYANLVAEMDAEKRAAEGLADSIATKLGVFLESTRTANER